MKRHNESPDGAARTLQEQKAQLRRTMQARRDALDPVERECASAAIGSEVIRLLEPVYARSNEMVDGGQPVLFTYAPFRSEVELSAVWSWCREAGILLVLPKVIPVEDGRSDDGGGGGANVGDADGAIRSVRFPLATSTYALSPRYRMQLHRVDCAEEDLAPGRWGIPEPNSTCPVLPETEYGRIRAMLVPGLAFDPELGRLGYGGGFYDRFFAVCLQVTGRLPLRIAPAFDEQIVDLVPVEAHDVRMSVVVTEKRRFVSGGDFFAG